MRPVTLLQGEHLPLLADRCGGGALDAVPLRRNLLISGLNVISLRPSAATATGQNAARCATVHWRAHRP